MQTLRRVWEKLIALVLYTFSHQSLLFHDQTMTSGVDGMILRCNMGMRILPEMLRIKRSVSASYTQTHFILPENMIQKDSRLNLEETVDTLKCAGVPEDEMANLERQLAPAAQDNSTRRLGFVSAGVESQSSVIHTPDGGRKVVADQDAIELPEDDDEEGDKEVEIAQRDDPAAVFGDLAQKVVKEVGEDGDARKQAWRLGLFSLLLLLPVVVKE